MSAMEIKNEISREEVISVLHQIIDGELVINDDSAQDAKKINWWQVNEPWFNFGGWTIVFFIEADWIYDVYNVYAPDGRETVFMPSGPNKSSIKGFISSHETAKLIKVIGGPITDAEIEEIRVRDS